MKHGETKETFATGAQRDTTKGKLRYDLLSPLADYREAQIMTAGAEHYGDRNWEKGMPFMRVVASLKRHLADWLMGKTDEDHLAQATWNARALLHFDEAVKRGLLPTSLDDRPVYGTKPGPATDPLSEAIAAVNRHHIKGETPPSFVKGEPHNQASTPPKSVHTSGYAQLCADKVERPEVPVGAIPQVVKDLLNLGANPQVAHLINAGMTHPNPRYSLSHKALVYVCGPMRGVKDYNFPAFDEARGTFLTLGYAVISPADIDRADKEFIRSQDVYLERDILALRLLAKHNPSGKNGIVTLPGWTKSVGASGEVFAARWLGLKAYFANGREQSMDSAVAFHAWSNVR